MATHLIPHVDTLRVYNRSEGARANLASVGAIATNSADEAVLGCQVVFTMLSTPEVVDQLAFGATGFLQSMEKGALWVDCSTVDPAFARNSDQKAREAGIRYLNAPVAGTKPHAEKAELTFFVGGEATDLEQIEPLLQRMGQKVLYLGSAGMGSAFKMLVNSMLAQSMLMFSETVVLGQRMGLDRSFLLKTLPKLVVAAPFTQAKAGMIEEGEYEAQFPMEWMQKDLHLAAKAAYEVGQPLLLANIAKEVYMQAVQAGLGRKDFAAIHQWLEQKK
jgi:3-hydroxyisobutyrate dehydrogenase-like beta-hydroxyacid dehydrogenase